MCYSETEVPPEAQRAGFRDIGTIFVRYICDLRAGFARKFPNQICDLCAGFARNFSVGSIKVSGSMYAMLVEAFSTKNIL